MNINEIFYSLQGEGEYAGFPAVFVRLSGCNMKCSWCDTNHRQSQSMSVDDVVNAIAPYIENGDIFFKTNIVVITGGEPTLQMDEVLELIIKTKEKFEDDYCIVEFHLETNGTYENLELMFESFDYVAVSPKTYNIAKKVSDFVSNSDVFYDCDIKVVTDGDTLNKNLFSFATMLMPLTTFDTVQDGFIKKRVWDLCKSLRKRYSSRIQADIFGKMRGV